MNYQFRRTTLAQGDIIAIILTHSVKLYTVFLGAMTAGLIPTIMPFPTPKQDRAKYWKSHRALFELSNIRAVFTYPDNLAGVNEHLGAILAYVGTSDDTSGCAQSTEITHNDVALLQHSSGTTSLRKG